MRLLIRILSPKSVFIPFDYHYQMHSAIYSLIGKSSPGYSAFLHNTGFIDNNKQLKLFVFSKLNLPGAKITKSGFENVKEAFLNFSTPIPKSFEHLVLGIFSDQELILKLSGKQLEFRIENVETLPDPDFSPEMRFTCLSPIAVAGNSTSYSGKHYLDYMIPIEKDEYILGIKNNLLRKYRLVYGRDYVGNESFYFSFDPIYIVKKQGKIKKNVKFKDGRIIGMEAPFTIEADPELIRIGYECGFGSENSAGFGMVEKATIPLSHSKSPEGDVAQHRPNEREK